jgi:hypothetical protein
VNLSQAEEFLIHAVKYLFPAVAEGEGRGMPTAWGAEPLTSRIASPPNVLDPVWPDARGRRRELVVRPSHDSVPEAPRRDPRFGERLALVDALRLVTPHPRCSGGVAHQLSGATRRVRSRSGAARLALHRARLDGLRLRGPARSAGRGRGSGHVQSLGPLRPRRRRTASFRQQPHRSAAPSAKLP